MSRPVKLQHRGAGSCRGVGHQGLVVLERRAPGREIPGALSRSPCPPAHVQTAKDEGDGPAPLLGGDGARHDVGGGRGRDALAQTNRRAREEEPGQRAGEQRDAGSGSCRGRLHGSQAGTPS